MRFFHILHFYASVVMLLFACTDGMTKGGVEQPTGWRPSWKHRALAVSSNGPIATALRNDAAANKGVKTLLSHFDDVGRTTKTCLRRNTYWWMHSDMTARFLSFDDHLSVAREYQRGCVNIVQLQKNAEKVWDAMEAIENAIRASSIAIAHDTRINWTPWYPSHLPKSLIDNCEARQTGGVRFNGTWTVRARVASHPGHMPVGTPYGFLTEFLEPTKNGSFRAMARPIMGQDGRIHKGATTTVRYRIQTDKGVTFKTMDLRGNYQHARWVSGLHATLIPSEIAALALPLVLTLVPAAAVADIGSFSFFFYALLTDVANALPLIFKGAELIYSKYHPPVAIETMTVATDPEWMLATAWTKVLKCKPQDRFESIGLSLILVAFTAASFGLYLEFVAHRKLVEMKKKHFAKMSLYCCGGVKMCPKCRLQVSPDSLGSKLPNLTIPSILYEVWLWLGSRWTKVNFHRVIFYVIPHAKCPPIQVTRFFEAHEK